MDWGNIIVPVVTALIASFATWLVQKNLQEKRDIERRLSEKRHELYMGILDYYIRAITGTDDAKKLRKTAFSYEYKKKAFELVLIGEDSVIKAYNKFLDYSRTLEKGEKSSDEYAEMRLFARLLIEIRKSLGYKKTKLTDIEILKPFIKDAERLKESLC